MFEAEIAALAEAAPQVIVARPVVPGLVLHVDGDYLVYYCAGKDTAPDCRQAALAQIAQAKRASGAESVVVHNTLSGSHKGERYLVATLKPYQQARAGNDKPGHYDYLRELMLNYQGPEFKVKNWMSREADDGIAACAHYAANMGKQVAIFTRDKDMRVLPGLHVIWLTKQIVEVAPGAFNVIGPDVKQYGMKFFWIQMLMGDTVDNIPGLESYQGFNAKGESVLKKMGEKTAEKFLSEITNSKDAYLLVEQLYVNRYQTEDAPRGFWADRFCEQAALLWMRTDNAASVADFARHNGFSRINEEFGEQMWEAVARLEARVKDARNKIDALAA